MLFYILLILGGIAVDQFSKYLAVVFLSPVSTVPIVPHVFHLTYVENNGAAFSMLSGKQTFLIIITAAFILALIYILWVMPKKRRYYDINFALSLIISGAIGNLIDRIRLNYVIDFFDVRLIGFAIFNIADIFVVAGCLLAVIALFRNKELLNDPPIGHKKKDKSSAQKASPKDDGAKGPKEGAAKKKKRRRSLEELTPEVKTKIEDLPEHLGSVTFNPGPPPEALHDKDNTEK
ncbi:MAG: signal peptidase II [Eubacterium sp.]|nr:signal peptidase II [Eubacterium sp.]